MTSTRRLQGPFWTNGTWKHAAVAMATGIVVLALCLVALQSLVIAQDAALHARAEAAETRGTERLADLGVQQTAYLKAVRAYMTSTGAVTQQNFAAFTQDIGAATTTLGGIQSIEYVRRVPAMDKGVVENSVRESTDMPEPYRSQFRIKPWPGESLGQPQFHDVVWFTSAPGQLSRVGIDLATEPIRRTMLEVAARNPTDAWASPALPLGANGAPGLLLAMAVQNEVGATEGFVISSIIVDAWLGPLIREDRICVDVPGMHLTCQGNAQEVVVAGQSWWVTTLVAPSAADRLSQWFLIMAVVLLSAGSGTLVYMNSDRQAALEQLVVNRTAELAARNQELEEFVYVASHDLQAPLRHISGYAELLERDLQTDPSRVPEDVSRIQAGTERMRGLIEGILSLSRTTRGGLRAETVDLNIVVGEALDTLHDDVTKANATVHVDRLPTISCDPIQVGQVFQNLLDNALKFTSGPAPQIWVRAEQGNGIIAIFVEDNGTGIPAPQRANVFGMFHRGVHREHGAGHGIGLSVVRRVMQLHKGSATADERAGGGTSIKLEFPR